MTAIATDRIVDLRRGPLSALRAIDFRSPRRDYWADEAAIHDRLVAAWAGLDDAAWRLPGAAPSDAGGPDWSLLISWAYEDLHGHVRAHHAMIGPWVARVGWPPAEASAPPDLRAATAPDHASATPTAAGGSR